jgi:hypothetical protein
VRLIPRLNSKTKIWPGGPDVGQVFEAQLNPAARSAAAVVEGSVVEPVIEAPPAQASAEVELLLVLR